MVTRLSQKQVETEFYEECREAKVPCFHHHKANQGHFMLQGSYGGLQLQYVYACGGVKSLTSGFVGAREMYNELRRFHLPTLYKNMRKMEAYICKDKKKKDEKRRAAQVRR
jgi:siroheme synthase (precorrin-2 oxidase/ferrochelatase)